MKKPTTDQIRYFMRESNKIENILREPTEAELTATASFLGLQEIHIEDLENYVSVCQPGHRIRDRIGDDVRIGNHYPPPGGARIPNRLREILEHANAMVDPYHVHVDYEMLHPFTDGNGRSGRMLWAWQMVRQDIWPGLNLGFLHAFYYQALDHSRK